MNILLAFDKFKGSLSAREACEALARGLQAGGLEAEHTLCPIADGGEGFAEAIVEANKGEWRSCRAVDPMGRKIRARYGLYHHGEILVAVMEMAEASGMWRVNEEHADVMQATTAGTGQMIRHAVQKSHADRLLLGIGGSATNDGGAGMAAALGVAFRDSKQMELEPVPSSLETVAEVCEGGRIRLPHIEVACDVENPLLGPQGATTVYGPQKGAGPAEQQKLEQMLTRLVEAANAQELSKHPGAGAAGGLGFGLMRFAGATLRPGFDMVAEALELEQLLAKADVVITGEGSLDQQTLSGKGPAELAKMARTAGVKMIGIGGRVTEEVRASGLFDLLGTLEEFHLPQEESMRRGAELLQITGEKLVGLLAGLAPR